MKKKYLLFALLSGTLFTATAQTQIIQTVVGTGTKGYSDGSPGTSMMVNYTKHFAIYKNNLYFVDENNLRVRMYNPSTGNVSTVAGNGTNKHTGDGGTATSASLYNPWGIAIDNNGNMYISELNGGGTSGIGSAIRVVNLNSGVIQTFVGPSVYSPTITYKLNAPTGLALDPAGNLYIADENVYIRKVAADGSSITTILGNGSTGNAADGAVATASPANTIDGLTYNLNDNNLYYADANAGAVHYINLATGKVYNYAGTGSPGYSKTLGTATATQLSSPCDIVFDADNNGYILDGDLNVGVIYKVSSGQMSLFGGVKGAKTFGGDGGAVLNASFYLPTALALDGSGNMYIGDAMNYRIRYVTDAVSMPVTLLNFTATLQNKTVQLDWHTATEINNQGFTIQRSTDGKNFTNIGYVAAQTANGNSTKTLSYTYTDASPLQGTNYYRLEQTDIDGAQVLYPKTLSVNFSGTINNLQVYPNPAHGTININGLQPGSNIAIYNTNGSLVKSLTATTASQQVDISNLVQGIYIVKVLGSNLSKRFIVQ